MNSLVFRGSVFHHRVRPLDHQFVFPMHYYAFDLDELEVLNNKYWFFGYNSIRPISVHDKDYLAPNGGSLREKLLRKLSDRAYVNKIEKIMLVTSARYLNYVFNPVSFFYCYGAKGEILAVVAEVNNTFGERHPYILDQELGEDRGSRYLYRARKVFHVSPFNDMTGEYDFRFSDLGKKLNIGIDMIRESELTLKTSLSGEGVKIGSRTILDTVVRYPLGVFLTMPRICWEAGKLYYRKKMPFHSKPVPISSDTLTVKSPNLFQSIGKKIFLRVLSGATREGLRLILPDGSELLLGNDTGRSHPKLHVKSYEFFTRLLKSADIGFGESYSERLWETDDLTGVLRFFAENDGICLDNKPVLSFVSRISNRIFHLARGNSLKGSKDNISAHYDLSNELFGLFLDDSMSYSAASFVNGEETLGDAQARKLKKIIGKAEIRESDHVLEIGCGWGGFALAAVKETGCRVTGVTLSHQQFEYAKAKIKQEGLEDKINIELCDYRKIEGNFDKIVSVEMLEAVGHENHAEFFQVCDKLLKPGGKAVYQVITILDDRYEEYRKNCDWIQRYIFPGGCLPSLGRLTEVITGSSTLEISSLESMGQDYARTLEIWRAKFNSAQQDVLELGFDQKFIRMWNYYLSYCEAGFLAGPINVIQFVLSRPSFRESREIA